MKELTPKEAVQLRIRGYEAVAEIQREELRRMDDNATRTAIRSLCFDMPDCWRPEWFEKHSGLEEQQTWFRKFQASAL